ncbi:MAG: helix-turn-helix transcriptional regulator [Kiloniellaceae bacterium]
MTDNLAGSAPGPDPIDTAIGSRLRLRRLAMGFSQETLARALGITFQQIQKYERGSNRIFASRLYHLAQALRVPLAYFFEDIAAKRGNATTTSGDDDQAAADQKLDPLFGRPDTVKLVQAYNKIDDPSVRRQIYALVKSLGEQDRRDRRIL